MIYLIYALIDPRDNQIKYIGKTNNLERRIKEHFSYRKNTLCSNWIQSLKNVNMKPIFQIIDEVENWQFWEQHYISLYWGFDLKNHTKGGEGASFNIFSLKYPKHKAIIDLERFRGVFKTLIKQNKVSILILKKKKRINHLKTILQFDLDGNLLFKKNIHEIKKEFPDLGRIELTKKFSWNNYRWCYEGEKLKDEKKFRNTIIHQYDIKNNFIKKWYSIKEAEESLNIKGISSILYKGKNKLAGYLWKTNKF